MIMYKTFCTLLRGLRGEGGGVNAHFKEFTVSGLKSLNGVADRMFVWFCHSYSCGTRQARNDFANPWCNTTTGMFMLWSLSMT